MKIVVFISTIVHGQKIDHFQIKEANQLTFLNRTKSLERIKSPEKGNVKPVRKCIKAASALLKTEVGKNAENGKIEFTGFMFRPKSLKYLPSRTSGKKEKKENPEPVPFKEKFTCNNAHCPDPKKTIRYYSGWLFYLS